MYQINIWLNDCPANFIFNYREESTAKAAIENIRARKKEEKECHVTVKDDYGHVLDAQASDIQGVLLTSLTEEFECQIDKKILEAHAQKKLQDYVRTDPMLNLVRPAGILNG